MIEVFHRAVPAFFEDHTIRRDTFNAAVKVGGFIFVAQVDTDDLERAWELTNTIERCWWENDGVTAPDGGRCQPTRSSSVGDVFVTDGGVPYQVANLGFTEIV